MITVKINSKKVNGNENPKNDVKKNSQKDHY